jgi:Doubled CXXCH motif (Paired_CXXCH_1)
MKAIWQLGRRQWRAASAGVVAALFLLLGGTAAAQTGIASTKHNLGSSSTAGNNSVSETAEVCVFCHTPHGGSTSAPVPLWNKRLSTDGSPAGGGSYTTYASLGTPSLDGTVAPVGSISLACLSCHDGTQAMDNIINAPGSGQLLDNGGDINGRPYTWTSPGNSVDSNGRLISGAAAIGTDLSNDHPIGIQYCGGGVGATGAIANCRDQDFNPLQTASINNNNVFWVETGGGGKQRTDLPLYVRTAASTGGTDLGPLVECGSCHDPHVSTNQPGPTGTGRVAGETFLRISNASSAVCTACHVK